MHKNNSPSPPPQNVDPAVLDRLQDPRMRFRTITSLIALLRQFLHTKAPGKQYPQSLPKISHRRAVQLRMLTAFATLLVRNKEVVAVVAAPEQVSVVYNPSADAGSDCRNTPKHISRGAPGDRSRKPIPNLVSEPDPGDLLTYLTEIGANQTFDDHAKVIMQFANRFRNVDPTDERQNFLMPKFLVYVVGSSAPRMHHRITHPTYSQPYFESIVGLPTSDVEWVGERVSSPNEWDVYFIALLHSVRGIRILQEIQRYLVGPAPVDPPGKRPEARKGPTEETRKRLVEELRPGGAEESDGYKLLFPNLWNLTPGSKALYTQATCREFHQILSISLMGYRDSLDRLVGLSNPTKDELWVSIGAIYNYLTILHPIAHSAAIIDHLSVVVKATRAREDPTAQEPPAGGIAAPGDEAEDHEEMLQRSTDPAHELEQTQDQGGAGELKQEEILEDQADMDVTDEGTPPPFPDTPHIRWLQLQVAYFGAFTEITALFELDSHFPDAIELEVYPIPYTGRAMAPLMQVIEGVVDRHGLGSQSTDKPAMEMVNDALEVMRQSADESTIAFCNSWDRMSLGSGFNGRVHCEAALASRMLEPPENGFPMYDKCIIGISQRCCPVCSAILEAMSPREHIHTLGSHRTTMPCALPDDLPPWLIDKILQKFEQELAIALGKMYESTQHSRTGSGSSHGSADLHPLGNVRRLRPAFRFFDWD